jgi:hypothetical protein
MGADGHAQPSAPWPLARRTSPVRPPGLLSAVRCAATGETRFPQSPSFSAMLRQRHVLPTLRVLLLHRREFRLQLLQPRDEAGQVALPSGISSCRRELVPVLFFWGLRYRINRDGVAHYVPISSCSQPNVANHSPGGPMQNRSYR